MPQQVVTSGLHRSRSGQPLSAPTVRSSMGDRTEDNWKPIENGEGEVKEGKVLIVRKRASNARKTLEGHFEEELEVKTEVTKIFKRVPPNATEPQTNNPKDLTCPNEPAPDKILFRQSEGRNAHEKDGVESLYTHGRRPEQASRIAIGPAKPSTTIRFSNRIDYAADLCKDYNETGFCGFGDSCKFIHDRGDYKSGWELDLEWAEKQERDEREQLRAEEDGEREAADIARVDPTPAVPTLCGICDQPFRKPILVTRCNHYFCERCALAHAKKTPKCSVCDATIEGGFCIHKEPRKQ